MSNYVPTQWNAVCDVCGFKFKSSKLKTDWRGLKVCHKDFELRHPQDLIQIPSDDSSVPWTRPESVNIFLPYSISSDKIIVLDNLNLNTFWNRAIPRTETLSSFTTLNSKALNTIPLAGADYQNLLPNTEIINITDSLRTSFNFNQVLASSASLTDNLNSSAGYSRTISDPISSFDSSTSNLMSANLLNTLSLNNRILN